MKRSFPAAIVAAALALVTSGCANQGTSSTTNSAANPTKRTYNESDLQNTGVNTTAEAVQKLVPAATVHER